MKIVNVVGARPNLMKVAPLMEAFAARPGIEALLVHTGQHYDANMSDLFFRQLGIPEPDLNLGVGSGSHAVQTAEIMKRFEPVLLEHRPDAVLVVGDGAVREDLEREARAAGLDRIVFTGRLPKADMPRVLAASDACLVHLARRELFRSVMPSKIFEAAAMAKPILLGVEGFAAEVVEQAGAGICIEPENAAQLVEAVLRLASDRELARRLGRAGSERIARAYDYSELAREYAALIRGVLAAEARP